MRGYYHVNERLSRSHSSHWWGAGILWMSDELSDCALHTAERHSAAGLHADTVGFPSGICGDVRSLCSRICLRLSTPPWNGAWEARLMSCPAGSTVRGIRTFSWHKLITRVPKVHRWSEGRRTTFKKCHTHLNAAEEQPWGLPSNERTLTVSCNSLSHNLGSAKWRKDSDGIVPGAAFILPLELVFACFATIGQSFGLAWANRSSGKVGGKEFP